MPLPPRFLFLRAVAVLLLFSGWSTLLSFAVDSEVGKGNFGVAVELDGVKAGKGVSVWVGLDDEVVTDFNSGVDVGFNSGFWVGADVGNGGGVWFGCNVGSGGRARATTGNGGIWVGSGVGSGGMGSSGDKFGLGFKATTDFGWRAVLTGWECFLAIVLCFTMGMEASG